MKRILFPVLLFITTFSMSTAQSTTSDGWRSLFDGQSMEGWRFFKGRENNSWEVKDGALHCKNSQEADKRADLVTNGKYKDFELILQWKIAKGSNSGIMYRVSEKYDAPYLTGPEYQIIDDRGYPESLTALQKTGADYDMMPAGNSPIKPAGEWNQTRILVNGTHVEHWLNGKKLFEFEQFSEEWLKRKEKSKWKDAKAYGTVKKGFICLQDHGDEIWIKDIQIRKL